MTMQFFYCPGGLTGGAAETVDSLSIDNLKNRDMTIGVESSVGYLYRFHSESDVGESPPNYIKPDDATGPGRWHLQDMGVVGGSDFSYACFQHQEASGVSGGRRDANSWTQRVYNTSVINDITDCSLSAGDITIPSGKYDFRIVDVQYRGQLWRVKLLNITEGTDIAIGPSCWDHKTTSDNNVAVMQGRFTVSSTTTIGTRIYSSNGNDYGMGRAAGVSGADQKELFGSMELWRIGEA